MKEGPNLATLLEVGDHAEAISLLRDGVQLVGAVDYRSDRAALKAATRLFAGDLLSTIFFMNKPHPWLDGQTPLERAEQSEEGLEFVIEMIGAIEAGVYI